MHFQRPQGIALLSFEARELLYCNLICMHAASGLHSSVSLSIVQHLQSHVVRDVHSDVHMHLRQQIQCSHAGGK